MDSKANNAINSAFGEPGKSPGGNQAFCLVLSGGGAKGVYHLGVWRALQELGIEVQAFMGTSIGAIVAAFLAQGADAQVENLFRSVSVESILDLPAELIENGKLKIDRGSLVGARKLLRTIVEKRGIDTSPFRKLLATQLNEGAIRQSGMDLGMVTINLDDYKPREVFLDELEPGTLVDFLMASAAFPGFAQPVIAGKRYIDGGLYDNIPYAMARKRGYRRIIVSDISGAGRNRKPEIAGSQTIYMKNSIDLGGVLDFSPLFLDRFTLLGYLDTLRSFGKLKGYAYFVQPDKEAETAFASAQRDCQHNNLLLPEHMRYDRDHLLTSLECAASVLRVQRIRRYTYQELNTAIETQKNLEGQRLSTFLGQQKNKEKDTKTMIRQAMDQGVFEHSPYFYWQVLDRNVPQAAQKTLKTALVRLFPELPAGMAYLEKHWQLKKDQST